MSKSLKVLGDGQVWDVRGVSPHTPDATFEDLFSGRALAQMASEFSDIFSPFRERGRLTGLSVTKALLSRNSQAKNMAKLVLKDLAKNGALGIEALIKGRGFKENWPSQQKNYWKNLDTVVIGGGVSEGLTGKILVGAIKEYLSEDGLSNMEVYQAKFPGKEAGFLGAVINLLEPICRQARKKGLKKIAALGLDVGRDRLGAGLLTINSASVKIIPQKNKYWLFEYSASTPRKSCLKKFLDSRRDYVAAERKLGRNIRKAMVEKMADLMIKAKNKAEGLGLVCSRNIGVAVPGRVSRGFILDSADYLPFFRKKDGFNLAQALEGILARKEKQDFRCHLINDGIAAGIANAYFAPFRAKNAKFCFLGVGSGLGGCIGVMR